MLDYTLIKGGCKNFILNYIGYYDKSLEEYIFAHIELIKDIQTNPYGRRHIMSFWHWANIDKKSLVECAYETIWNVRGEYLDMMMVQRSCDMFLGVPFNIASGAALLTLIAHHTEYEPGKFHWVGNCCHLYENHIEQAKELITREPYAFPKLEVNWKDNIGDYLKTDFTIVDYNHHPKLTAPLSVGI